MFSADDYSIKGVMAALDVDRHEFISSEDIYKFIKGHGIEIEMTQADTFVSMYDSNLDGKLDINELQWAIEGMEAELTLDYVRKLQFGIRKP